MKTPLPRQEEQAAGGSLSRKVRDMPWLPIPLLLGTIVALWQADLRASHPAPHLLTGLNFAFLTLSSFVIAYLVGRSFLLRGAPGLLMLGCGVVIWACAGIVATTVGHSDVNLQVTIYNLCAWFSGLCHLAGGIMSLKARRSLQSATLWIPAAYTLAVGVVGLVTLAAIAGWVPTFFVQDEGGTPLRQLVLGSAVGMFALTGALLALWGQRPLSSFVYWYALALALVAAGLFGVMVQTVHDSVLSWVGRGTQYAGGLYMLIAAVAAFRETHAWNVSLEAALSQAHQRTANILESISDSFIQLDPNGCFAEINPATEKLLGKARQELLGRSYWEVYPEAGSRRFGAEYRRAMAENVPVQFEALHPEPLNRWLECRAYPGEDGLSIFLRDITERKQAQEALAASEARLRQIIDNAQAVIWLKDVDGQFRVANGYLQKLSGLSEAQIAGRTVFDLFPAELAQQYAANDQKVLASGKTMEFEETVASVNGPLTLLAIKFPVRDAEGRITSLCGLCTDITDRKRMEEEVQAAQIKLRAHAEDLERTVAGRTARLQETVDELEHFSYAIAHDLRAPLRAMQGFACMIEEDYKLAEPAVIWDYIRRIKNAACRMDQLIADILSYSRVARQELTLKPVDLRQLLLGLIESYPNLLPDQADIQIAQDLPVVLGNESALTQCFSNLLGNAVKFAKPGVRPQVRIWAEESGADGLAALAGQPAPVAPCPSAIIWVQDNGIGVPKEVQHRIFGMFERGTKEHEGTGIGLAIVRKVVQRMEGRVGVVSQEGHGARFWVELRSARAPEPEFGPFKRSEILSADL